MGKQRKLLFIGLVFLLFTISQIEVCRSQSTDLDKYSKSPVSVLFLLDASGSMRQNDPDKLWQSAVQLVVSELTPQDRIAIVQFEADASKLKGESGETWLVPYLDNEVVQIINNVGDDGLFTDYRVGLLQALDVFRDTPETHRKIVLLLSDGVLDPNPRDPAYTPHNYSYARDIISADRSRRREINEKYRRKLSPIARRLIYQNIIPEYKKAGIEIFTVALGPNADYELMQHLSDESSLHTNEVHSFHATRATDLLEVFAALLQYWSPVTVFRKSDGVIGPGNADSICFDNWVMDAQLISVIDGDAQARMYAENGENIPAVKDLHPSLHYYNIPSGISDQTWNYRFESGQGYYRLIWLGRNQLNMNVTGLQDSYNYGDTVKATVKLNDFSSATNQNSIERTTITANITDERGNSAHYELQIDNERIHRLEFIPVRSGDYSVRFTAAVIDSDNNEILPRPGVLYKFRVRPAFYVTPRHFSFDDVSEGTGLELPVEIHSGLTGSRYVILFGRIDNSSSDNFHENRIDRLPKVADMSFYIDEGSKIEKTIIIDLPESMGWGDYEGTITFNVEDSKDYDISYALHIPSIWEKIRIPLFLLILLILALIAFFIYIWGYLASPTGVLVPEGSQGGRLAPPIYLSQVKRDLIHRWVHWKRNILTIGNRNCDIPNSALPVNLKGELAFYHLGKAYVKNISNPDSESDIFVEEPGLGEFRLGPGRSLRLKHKSVLIFDNIKFRYESLLRR